MRSFLKPLYFNPEGVVNRPRKKQENETLYDMIKIYSNLADISVEK